MSQAAPIVHLVDDDESFLKAASRLLRASGFETATFSSAADFLAQHRADLRGCVVTDLQMPGLSGLDFQAALARTANPLPVLFLSGEGDIPASVHAMRGGAEDFIEKRAPRQQLIEAVRRALARDEREHAERGRLRGLRERFDMLTEREFEVLRHVVAGKMNKEIAADLGIHERTVKLHRTAVTTKLRVQSVAELTRLAQEAGVFSPGAATFPKGQ